MEETPAGKEKVRKPPLFAVFLRSFFLQTLMSYVRMQGLGFGLSMLPFIKHAGIEGERLKSFLKRHLSFFNAHPYLAAYALGAVGKMETEGVGEAEITEFKSRIMGPLGVFGDQIFWARFRPLVAMTTIIILMYLNWPPITGYRLEIIWILTGAFIIYNWVHFAVRWQGLVWGYASGKAVLRVLTRSRLVKYRLHLGLGTAFAAGIFLIKSYEVIDNSYVFMGSFLTATISLKMKAPLWITLLLVFSVTLGISFITGFKI